MEMWSGRYFFYFSFSLFVSFSISFNKIPVAEGPGDTNKTGERFFSALSGSIRLIHMHDNISDICGMKGGPAQSSLLYGHEQAVSPQVKFLLR